MLWDSLSVVLVLQYKGQQLLSLSFSYKSSYILIFQYHHIHTPSCMYTCTLF